MPSIHDAAHAGDHDAICRMLEEHPGRVDDASGSVGATPLHYARNAAIADLLIRRGATIDARDYQGRTPLHRHCQYADLGVAALLARSGADLRTPDDLGNTPMLLAAGNSEGEDIVRLLMGYRVPLDLNSALLCGMIDEARRLLATDPDAVSRAPKAGWLLENFAFMVSGEVLEQAGGDDLFGPNLEIADRVIGDHLDLLDALIARGAPTTNGAAALREALTLPHPAVAERLLAAGVPLGDDPSFWLLGAAERSARREEMLALLARYGVAPKNPRHGTE